MALIVNVQEMHTDVLTQKVSSLVASITLSCLRFERKSPDLARRRAYWKSSRGTTRRLDERMETSKEPGRVVQILLTVLVFKATRMLGRLEQHRRSRLPVGQIWYGARTQRVAALLPCWRRFLPPSAALFEAIVRCSAAQRDAKHHVQPAMGRQALEPRDEEAPISASESRHGPDRRKVQD